MGQPKNYVQWQTSLIFIDLFYVTLVESCAEETEKKNIKEQEKSCVIVNYKDIHMVSSVHDNTYQSGIFFRLIAYSTRYAHVTFRFLLLRNMPLETRSKLD